MVSKAAMTELRVGIIGWGLAGRGFHGGFVRAVEGLALRSVATSREVDPAFGDVRVVSSAEAIIDDPDIDLVVVASPNRSHVPQARAALEAKKHVVVEKPVAANAAELRELVALAEDVDRLLVPYQNRRFDGDFLTVRSLLESGRLGRVHAFESSWPAYRPSTKQRSAWKAEPDPMHGLLFDLGPHLVDQAIALFGRPERVFGRVQTRRDGSDVVDVFALTTTYADGLTVRLGVDQLDPFDPPRFAVRGSAGAYVKYGVDAQEAQIREGRFADEVEDWGVEDAAAYGTLKTPEGTTTIPTERGDYRRFYAALRDAIRTGAPPPIDPSDVVLQLEIFEAAMRSSRTGEAIAIPGGER